MEITIEDLKQIRNYFGEHDVSIFEHKAFDIMNALVKEREGISLCPVCEVPMRIHGTACGWQNANLIINAKNADELEWQQKSLEANNANVNGNILIFSAK